MKTKVVAGVDIGGTNTAMGIVTIEGEILAKCNITTNTYSSVDEYISTISNAINVLLKTSSIEQQIELIGIGIGAPNANYHTGCIEDAVNLPWRTVPLVSLLQEHFPGLNIKITNDANAVAIAEKAYGNAKDLNDFVVITLGTGLGSGIFANGQIIYGHDGLAGEVGHTTAVPEGRLCNCTRKGCLETYVSAPGLKRTVFQMLAHSNKPSVLRDKSFNELSSKSVYEAAIEGDEIANDAFYETGKILGRSLADVVAYTSPKAIFIFGGLAESKELILAPAKKYMEAYLLPCYKNKVEILPSALGNKDAGIIGGSALIWVDHIK